MGIMRVAATATNGSALLPGNCFDPVQNGNTINTKILNEGNTE